MALITHDPCCKSVEIHALHDRCMQHEHVSELFGFACGRFSAKTGARMRASPTHSLAHANPVLTSIMQLPDVAILASVDNAGGWLVLVWLMQVIAKHEEICCAIGAQSLQCSRPVNIVAPVSLWIPGVRVVLKGLRYCIWFVHISSVCKLTFSKG